MVDRTLGRPKAESLHQDQSLPSITSRGMLLVRERPENTPQYSLEGIPETTALSSIAMGSESGKKQVNESLEPFTMTSKLLLTENPTRQARKSILSDYGLQEGREIPRRVYTSILYEIVKIERQHKEDMVLREIRSSRERRKMGVSIASAEIGKLPPVRTALPGFSYFPDQPKHKVHPEGAEREAAVNTQRLRVHQEKTSRKMTLFHRRHASPKAMNARTRSTDTAELRSSAMQSPRF